MNFRGRERVEGKTLVAKGPAVLGGSLREPLPSPYLALLLPQLRHLRLHVELHPVVLEHLEGQHRMEQGTSGP